MLYSYLEQIKKTYPDFEVYLCESDDSGQYNDILIVNQSYIFRFPRFQTSASALARETKLLTWLQGRLPLPIPNPCFQNIHDSIPGKAFMGYRRIPGEKLTRQRLQSFKGQPAWSAIAAQLGNFLRDLHGLDVSDVDMKLILQDDRVYWTTMYAEIREVLFDAMRPDARRGVRQHFEQFLDTTPSQPFSPCLRHGDFGPSNILFYPDEWVVSGVIDFSSVAIGDPAVDLAALSCYGEDFLQQVMVDYPAQEGELQRARFYRGTFALQEALAGFKYHDREMYEAGMAAYL
ncbi:MAG: phosphotransferase [Anaerolineaceae bacterium]|jgi:aminoglycoside 2''-phosphotransferase|nr:phosphotransferase [Anaerolineaceae bacterium]